MFCESGPWWRTEDSRCLPDASSSAGSCSLYRGGGQKHEIHSLGATRCENCAASQRRICIFFGWGNVLTQAREHKAGRFSGSVLIVQFSSDSHRWLCSSQLYLFSFVLYISPFGLLPYSLSIYLSFHTFPFFLFSLFLSPLCSSLSLPSLFLL